MTWSCCLDQAFNMKLIKGLWQESRPSDSVLLLNMTRYCNNMTRPLPLRHHQAFTLIELLVVLAIIAVLAGLLLPTITQVKNAAHGVACQGKLRQIGMGFMAYAGDQDGEIPPWSEGCYAYQEFVGNYEFNNTPGANEGWGSLIYPYLGGPGTWKLYVCPLDQVKRDLTDRVSNGGHGTGASYSNNSQTKTAAALRGLSYVGSAANPHFTHTVRMNQLRYPADSVLVSDDSRIPLVGVSNGHLYTNSEYYPARHGNGLNVLFCDGHVSQVPCDPFFNWSATLPVIAGDYTTPRGRFWNARR